MQRPPSPCSPDRGCRRCGPALSSTSVAENWTTLRELLLPEAPKRGRAIESALRDAIRDGRLQPGARLPSSRDLAGQLGVARGTITAAYTQLVSEGYLLARHGSGTTVASLGTEEHPSPHQPGTPAWRLDLR